VDHEKEKASASETKAFLVSILSSRRSAAQRALKTRQGEFSGNHSFHIGSACRMMDVTGLCRFLNSTSIWLAPYAAPG